MTTRLLLVEDHPMSLMGLKMVLEKNDALEIVAEASDGRSAISKAQTLLPDVVLMDIGLPEIDGIEATQTIKKQHPAIRVLMLTSKDNEEDVFAALGAGADGYCMKGVSAENLLQAIMAVKEGTAWLDPAVARMVLAQLQGSRLQTATVAEKPVGPPKDCPLTDRELEVLKLIVDGHSNPQIAETLYITTATAKAHVHSILQKLCVDDRTQAAVLAMREGFV